MRRKIVVSLSLSVQLYSRVLFPGQDNATVYFVSFNKVISSSIIVLRSQDKHMLIAIITQLLLIRIVVKIKATLPNFVNRGKPINLDAYYE